MAERGKGFDLEEGLRDIGARLAYPASADLRPAVLARIEGPEGRGLLGWLRSPLSLAPAAATLVLLLAATLAFQPVAGEAAEALGLRGITLFRVPAVTPTDGPGPAVAGHLFPRGAKQVRLADADREAQFDVVIPSVLGDPADVLVHRTEGDGSMVFLVYTSGTGIPVAPTTGVSVLIVEARGELETQLLAKGIPPGTTVQELEVNGGRGVWIEGAPHQVFYRAPNGDILIDTVRLAGNVLLWEQDGLLMRVEAQVDREQALRIARSMR